MNSSYWSARQPLRDCKFAAKSSRILQKRNQGKPKFSGWVPCNMPALCTNSRKCWILCWTYLWCIRRSKFKQRTGLTRGIVIRLAISRPGVYSRPAFLEENLDAEWWMLPKTHHQTLDGYIFGSKIPGHGLRFQMWPGNSPLRLAFSYLFGHSGVPRISKQDNTVQIVPKYGP